MRGSIETRQDKTRQAYSDFSGSRDNWSPESDPSVFRARRTLIVHLNKLPSATSLNSRETELENVFDEP